MELIKAVGWLEPWGGRSSLGRVEEAEHDRPTGEPERSFLTLLGDGSTSPDASQRQYRRRLSWKLAGEPNTPSSTGVVPLDPPRP